MFPERQFLFVLALGLFASGVPGQAADKEKPGLDKAAVRKFMEYLAKNDIQLEEKEGYWWAVTEPKTEGYSVVVAFRTFPEGTSEADMKKQLSTINLAFMLNAPTRLAMSHPGLQVFDPNTKPPKMDQIPAIAKLEKLFKEYRFPESKK